VAARDELERQLALADGGVARDEHADLEHVEHHAVERRDLAQLLLHVGAQHVDHVLAGLRRPDERHARRASAQSTSALGRGDVVGHDDDDDVAPAHAFQRLAPQGRFELLDVIHLAAPEHLREQRMDQVQVADEAHAGLAQHLAGELAPGAGLSRRPGKPEPLAAVVKQLPYAEPGHRATTR
jgi:hypothetical protein